eukprot:7724406-Pyramimonas_sp.AAC.1
MKTATETREATAGIFKTLDPVDAALAGDDRPEGHQWRFSPLRFLRLLSDGEVEKCSLVCLVLEPF